MEDNYAHEMPQDEAPSFINSESLHKQQPWNSQCSEPSDIIFRQQWGLGLPKTPIGGQILCRVMSLVTSLIGMDPQMENLGLPGTWASLYMGLMGLCCVLTRSCIIFLHWRKKLLRERRAQQWVELMNASTFTYTPLMYWINMQRCHDINASIKIGPPTAVTNTEMNINIPVCLWESDTPEGSSYGLRGSSPKAETPVALQDALVVSRKPQFNQMPQHQTPIHIPNSHFSGDTLCPTPPQNASNAGTHCLLPIGHLS